MEIDFLMQRCGREIILELFENKEKQTATSIYKTTDITYIHITLIVKAMVDAGLIRREKTGRKYDLFLTEKGYQVVKSLKLIENILGGEQ